MHMPAMPRPNDKATKIAFKILGKPANYDYREPEALRKVNKKLEYDETIRVR
jgi:hypothetical protein